MLGENNTKGPGLVQIFLAEDGPERKKKLWSTIIGRGE